MKIFSSATALHIFILVALGGACNSARQVAVDDYAKLINCHLDNTFYLKSEQPVPIHELTIDTLLSNHFSFTSLNIANAFGFLDLLQQFREAEIGVERNENIDSRLHKMEITTKLAQYIDLASLEISSFASELDCEEERISQMADFLKGKEKQRETRLTVAAISIGAIGGIVSGVLSANDKTSLSGDFVGIGTGIAEAILGILILRNSRTVELQHPRNVLRDIWQGNGQSKIFPASVWYYLTYKSPDKPEELSLREKIVERWKGFRQINAQNEAGAKQFESQFLQDKGVYSTDDLYNRANMYDQIESAVKLIKQDLSMLLLEMKGSG